MALVARNAKEQLKIEISRSSSRHSVSSGSSSPKLLSPKDKKARNNFVLSPSMGTELERLKQTYTPVLILFHVDFNSVSNTLFDCDTDRKNLSHIQSLLIK
jgi:hypothetical protein